MPKLVPITRVMECGTHCWCCGERRQDVVSGGDTPGEDAVYGTYSICPECDHLICDECYDSDLGMCNRCAATAPEKRYEGVDQ